jgi:uncharacterized protein YhaN
MRFQRLDFIKYGKFTDRSIEFPVAKQDFHLIVGPNETGKSTLRSAVLDLLFGIPTRSPMGFLHPPNELRLGASIANQAGSLEFHRVKAHKHTLRSPVDAVLADEALIPFVGTADRNFFDQMFGLDHSRLVEGGNSILSAENDVGQVLFQSAAGIASLGKLRDALVDEAEKLWAPRKSVERAYYVGADQLEKATLALKEATVRAKAWAEANGRVETLEETLKKERDRHQQLQNKRSRLERVRRVSPYLRALRENEQLLAELGEVVDLPIEAANIFTAAERELAIAGQLLELRNTEVAKATKDLESVHVDTGVLEISADIVRLDEFRLQYIAYDQDIEQREKEVVNLWSEVCDACVQLSWKFESESSVTDRLPTLLVRRELGKLARDYSGLAQILRAANQAERAKLSEIESLSNQLADVQSGEAKPALRAALKNARTLGDPDTAIQKQQIALAKAKTALEGSLLALGQWHKPVPDLIAMQPPSQQKITILVQDRQTFIAERKAALARFENQKVTVAGIELEITQFKEQHNLTTQDAVFQARRDRDDSWGAIKTGDVNIQQGAQQFETTMSHADILADARLDNVEEATELQSKLYQLVREKQSLSTIEGQCTKLSDDLLQFDARWMEIAAGVGLAGMSLEDVRDWLAKREKALAAAEAYQEAQDGLDLVSQAVAESKISLASALREAGLQVAETDNLSALCVQTENFIQAVDGARIRRETISAQLNAAQTLVTTLKQATSDAKGGVDRWTAAWSNSLTKAGLSKDSDIGTVEGALELIAQIEEKLQKARQIRIERIDAMIADLKHFASEAQRLAHIIAPELSNQPATKIAQELAQRLTQAREAHAEATRLKKELHDANEKVIAAQESIQTATASLKPLMQRAGVNSSALLAEAIARSDKRRLLNAELVKNKTNLLDGGDGLTREIIESEVDAADLVQLAAELTQINNELSEIVQRQATLSADCTKALQALSEIGGSNAAAQAEAQRQEALAQMSDVADRYVKVFTAGRLLRWSIDRYREEKQGPLLARASAIFSNLTQESFKRLVVDFDREPMALEGQRSDGKLIGISGMSDGTRDQLYLALRLAALELHLEQAIKLPFIADDLFINYDNARSKAGLEALRTLSEQTQVIFLSHHDHLTPTVQEVFGKQVNTVLL